MNALPDLLIRSNPEIVCCILNCMTGYIQTKNIYSIQMLYSVQYTRYGYPTVDRRHQQIHGYSLFSITTDNGMRRSCHGYTNNNVKMILTSNGGMLSDGSGGGGVALHYTVAAV